LTDNKDKKAEGRADQDKGTFNKKKGETNIWPRQVANPALAR
jgi:hypothetical protein